MSEGLPQPATGEPEERLHTANVRVKGRCSAQNPSPR